MFKKIKVRLCINGKRNCSLQEDYGVFFDQLYIFCWNWKLEVNIILQKWIDVNLVLQKWTMEVNIYANRNGK
jgi:hypothetical protein